MEQTDVDLLRGLMIGGKQATTDNVERIWIAYDDGSMGEPKIPLEITVQLRKT